MKGCLRGQIDPVLEDLVSREAEILKLYFGLDGEEPNDAGPDPKSLRSAQ